MAQIPQNRFPVRPLVRDLDESCHRFFENFGGHLEDDTEAIQFALEIDKAIPASVAKPIPSFEEEQSMDPAPQKKPRSGLIDPGRGRLAEGFDPSVPRRPQRRNAPHRRRVKPGNRPRNQSGPRNPPVQQ